MEYNPICKQQGLKIGTGTVVIATGWKPVEAIAKHLEPHQYAAIGSLYSPAGVEYIVRNILANPHVTGILAFRLTRQDENSGSIDAFVNFMEAAWEIEGIPWEDVSRVRSLPFIVLDDFDHSNIFDCIERLSRRKPLGGEPRYYYPEITESAIMPGTMWGHRIEGKTIAHTWVRILHRIRTTGRESPSGYGTRQELIDLMAVVTDEPDEFNVPDWLPVDRPYLDSYYPQLLMDTPSGVKYTYGSRLRSHFGYDQVEQCITKLTYEPDAASAVMSLWDVEDHIKGGSPCLNHIWLRIIDGSLSLTAVFRSNDMFDAWCANAFGLRKLQMLVRDRLSKESGTRYGLAPLITLSQSAHIYDHSYGYADKVIKERYKAYPKSFDDPVGNYQIEIKDGVIAVNRMLPDGTICAQYRGSLSQVSNAIALDAPAMQPSHAMYLGRELQQAWDCLKQNRRYCQG